MDNLLEFSVGIKNMFFIFYSLWNKDKQKIPIKKLLGLKKNIIVKYYSGLTSSNSTSEAFISDSLVSLSFTLLYNS